MKFRNVLLIMILFICVFTTGSFLSEFLKPYYSEQMQSDINYTTNVYEKSYHDSENRIKNNNPQKTSQMFVKDKNGFIVPITIDDSTIQKMQPLPIFYKPGQYTYGASNQTPSYRESVILSKLGIRDPYKNNRCKMGPTKNGFVTWECA